MKVSLDTNQGVAVIMRKLHGNDIIWESSLPGLEPSENYDYQMLIYDASNYTNHCERARIHLIFKSRMFKIKDLQHHK